MRWFLLCTLLAGLIGESHLGAQIVARPDPAAPIDAGVRIRVSVSSPYRQSPFASRAQRLRGTVRAIASDTLYLELPNTIGLLAIPRAQIRALEVSLGEPSRWGSTLESGSVGAVIFMLRMLAAHQDRETRRFDEAWQAMAAGAGIGFSMGAYFGWRRPYERWRPARLP